MRGRVCVKTSVGLPPATPLRGTRQGAALPSGQTPAQGRWRRQRPARRRRAQGRASLRSVPWLRRRLASHQRCAETLARREGAGAANCRWARASPALLAGPTLEDPVLDGIRDMRHDLHSLPEVVPTALRLDYAAVDLAGRDVMVSCQVNVEKPLVVAEVKIGLAAVVQDEDLAMLGNNENAAW